MAVDHTSIPPWAQLYHAPSVRDPTVTQNPGALREGIAASIHTPDMDVDSNAKGLEDELLLPLPTPHDEGKTLKFLIGIATSWNYRTPHTHPKGGECKEAISRDGHGSGSGYKSVNPDPDPQNPNPNPRVYGLSTGRPN
ncbi:hypothetical protein B0H13DRAFT_1904491 [Mycena leptocephala]|nr:hypothetical protein B0H13DRAFT_1904491 [Mycena leptocephala]